VEICYGTAHSTPSGRQNQILAPDPDPEHLPLQTPQTPPHCHYRQMYCKKKSGNVGLQPWLVPVSTTHGTVYKHWGLPFCQLLNY